MNILGVYVSPVALVVLLLIVLVMVAVYQETTRWK